MWKQNPTPLWDLLSLWAPSIIILASYLCSHNTFAVNTQQKRAVWILCGPSKILCPFKYEGTSRSGFAL